MSPHPLRVLYVDDEEYLLDLAKIFLERTKEFIVDTCTSAVKALDMLHHTPFDAIISDYQMPEMDGIEFLIQVRAEIGDIPFILFTGKGREEVVIRAIDNGVDFYLQKGGDPKSQFSELVHKIKKSVERIQAVRALAENEERMRLALDGAKEGHWDVNIVTGKTYISPRACEMLGYPQDELQEILGFNRRSIIHPEDISKTEQIMKDYFQGKTEFFQVEQRLRMKCGEWKWMLVRGKVIEYDENHHPVRFVGTYTDITEQKQVEAELLLAKKDWETIFRAVGNPTFILDVDHTIIDANEAVLQMTGKSLEEIKGLKCWNIFHDPNGTSHPFGCPLEKMRSSGIMETVTIDAEIFNKTLMVSCTPVVDESGKIIKAIHIATDVTENIHLERYLQENRDYLNQIFTSVREGIVIVDAYTHEILDINPAAAQMIGAPKEEIILQRYHNYFFSSDCEKCPITDLMPEIDNSEQVLITTEGRKIPIIKYAVPFSFHGRECLLVTFIDNSEREKIYFDLLGAYRQLSDAKEELKSQYDDLVTLQNSLQASEIKYRSIIETTPNIIWDLSLDGIISYINPQCQDILGYTAEELIGLPIISLIPPDNQDDARYYLINRPSHDPNIITLDLPFIHKNGSVVILNIRSSHIVDMYGEQGGYRCVALDITDLIHSKHELEEKNRQVEQLIEQKTLFLYQLAHDLRTPLTPIIGMGPLLLDSVSDSDTRDYVRIFLDNISYLWKMIEEILVHVQLNSMYSLDTVEPCNLHTLIDDAITSNQHLAQQNELIIENNVDSDLVIPVLKLYTDLAFRNIINNAIKYNVPKGKVTISASVQGHDLIISISDTGVGIPKAIQDKIWDELFTGDISRKDPLSKGLGLPIAKKIIELQNGSIGVISDGHLTGSTFLIRLPYNGYNGE